MTWSLCGTLVVSIFGGESGVVTRIPLVAGVGGGVGTSTMAAAVRGQDRGIYRPGELVDVLVARASMVSLGAAQRALATCPQPRPVLVVVADQARGRLPDNAAHRLRMSEPYTAGIVHVPYVEAWRHLDQPIASAFHALTGGLTQQIPSRAARGFADTTARLVRALTARLDPAAPQPSTRGVAPGRAVLPAVLLPVSPRLPPPEPSPPTAARRRLPASDRTDRLFRPPPSGQPDHGRGSNRSNPRDDVRKGDRPCGDMLCWPW